MNIRDLEYFVTVADCLHFGRAAEICHVSQPALSIQIKKLEQFLGVGLLERTNKTVLVTDIGRILVEQARNILIQAKELRNLANLARDANYCEINLGIIHTVAPYLLPQIVAKVNQKFPKLMLYLSEGITAALLENLRKGELDAVILAFTDNPTEFVETDLFTEEFMLALPSSHQLAKQKIIYQAALSNMQLLLLDEGHCLREQALSICQAVNAQEFKKFRATSLETLRHMIAGGIGATLMPRLACKPYPGITYLTFYDAPVRKIIMLWRTSTTKTTMLSALATNIINIMNGILRITPAK